MKKIIYKIAVISPLLFFAGWSGAYAERSVQSQGFIDGIGHDHFFWYSMFCGLISIMVKIVDYVIAREIDKTNNTPPLEEIMKQGVPLLGWFVSATIVGYLGVVTGLLTTTPQTAVMVGVAWPIVYARMRKTLEQKELEKQGVAIQAKDL